MKKFSQLMFMIVAAANAPAAIIIDSTGLTPVNQANFATGTAISLGTGAAWTFTTGVLGTENVLASIGLEGRQSGQNTNTLTLQLWSNPANNNSTLDLPNAILLATSTNSTALTANTVSAFLFSGVTLANNTVYSVHVVGTAPGFGLVGTSSTNLVTGSNLFQNGAFVFSGGAVNGFDASFRVVTTVPESSAALLGGLGMLALLRRRRA